MSKEELLALPVSFYRNMKSSKAESLTVGRVLNGIKGNYYAADIQLIRSLRGQGKKQEADELKGNLHAVTFCATFAGRRLSSLYEHYNSVMVIDIDKLTEEEMKRVGECLHADSHVACFWVSPSGAGWKGLVPLSYLNDSAKIDVVEKHHHAFITLEEYFKTEYSITLDASGKDITRLCFMSWSPELLIKDECNRFEVDLAKMGAKTEGQRRIVPQSSGEPINWNKVDGQSQEDRTGNQYDRRLLERIYKYLKVRNLSITSTYDEWVKVAFAVAHTFHSVYGRRKFLELCQLDGAAHNEASSERLIYDAYNTPDKRTDFSTILYLAAQKGFRR